MLHLLSGTSPDCAHCGAQAKCAQATGRHEIPVACAHHPERSIASMSPVRPFVFVCLAPPALGATQSRREESKSFGSPEHQEKVRKPMDHLKRNLLVCLLTLVLTTFL